MVRDFPVSQRADLLARARSWLADPGPARPPRLAATVMLLRDGRQGLEVFMMRRSATMAFAAQMMVFPGGAVDPADSDPQLPFAGAAVDRWAELHHVDPALAAPVLAAAVREVYEECGVLLTDPSADPAAVDPTGAARTGLVEQALSIGQLLRDSRHRLRTDDFVAWAHWVTPPFEPRRYDTWFLAARMPAGQQVADVSGEADHSAWTTPAAALAADEAGTAALMPPTRVCLEELAAAGSVAAALTPRETLPRVEPRLVPLPDGQIVLRAELGQQSR